MWLQEILKLLFHHWAGASQEMIRNNLHIDAGCFNASSTGSLLHEFWLEYSW